MKSEIARNLMQIKAIKLNPQTPFTWASGIKSPIYCDNRVTLSFPVTRTLIKNSLGELAKTFGSFDCVAGVATAGIAHGALLADLLELPFIYVRAEAKSHGRQNQIEGEIASGQSALVVEDLISTGGSSLKAVEVLVEAGVKVVGVVAIFDYLFDIARDNFAEAGVIYKTLSDYETLIQEASNLGYISEHEKDILKVWNADPKGWYDKFFS